jgi:hypothetical protein
MTFQKGNQFGIKFKPGFIPWMKGKHHSVETRNKMRMSHIGLPRTKEHCAKLSVALKGRIFTEEHRRKLSIAGKKRKITWELRHVDRIGKTCSVCGNVFTVLPSRDDKEFCSRKCAIIGRRKGVYDRHGQNNPKWKGGITPLRRMIWKSDAYDSWRRSIFIRDNRTCQGCGTRKGELQVHHTPYEFANILKDFDIRSLEDALGCKILWDKKNGKVMCVRCHRRTYKFKGNQYRK